MYGSSPLQHYSRPAVWLSASVGGVQTVNQTLITLDLGLASRTRTAAAPPVRRSGVTVFFSFLTAPMLTSSHGPYCPCDRRHDVATLVNVNDDVQITHIIGGFQLQSRYVVDV